MLSTYFGDQKICYMDHFASYRDQLNCYKDQYWVLSEIEGSENLL